MHLPAEQQGGRLVEGEPSGTEPEQSPRVAIVSRQIALGRTHLVVGERLVGIAAEQLVEMSSSRDPHSRIVSQVERMTEEPWPNRPWLAVMPTAAPSTCRFPAWPRSCQVTSHSWANACAGTASPKQARPPLGLTGIRPPIVVSPSCSSRSASPALHRPMCSYQSSSRALDRSYTSARDRSSGPMPASSYAACAIESLN